MAMLEYRRKIDPARRVSMHALYGSDSTLGTKMFPKTMTVCDTPKELKNENFTHHRNHHTLGDSKDSQTQGHRWFSALASFDLWNR